METEQLTDGPLALLDPRDTMHADPGSGAGVPATLLR